MFLWWAKYSENQILDEGYINCPRCCKRQPAALTRQVESSYFSIIPLGTTEGPEYVQCKVCSGLFVSNEQCAFGHLENMPDWNCFKCNKPVPHDRTKCPHCGFRFTSSLGQ